MAMASPPGETFEGCLSVVRIQTLDQQRRDDVCNVARGKQDATAMPHWNPWTAPPEGSPFLKRKEGLLPPAGPG